MASRYSGGAIRSSYSAGGSAGGSSFTGGWGTTGGLRQGINLSPMQADPAAYSMYLQDMFGKKIAKEEEEMQRKLSDLERRINSYESRLSRGEKLSTTDNMQYQKLISQYNNVLNPGKGYIGTREAPQKKSSKSLIEQEIDRQRQIASLRGSLEGQEVTGGRRAAEEQRLAGLEATSRSIGAAQIAMDPQKQQQLELSKQRQELQQKKFDTKEDEKAAVADVVNEINEWIRANPNRIEDIARLRKVMNDARKPGASSDTIISQAQAIAGSEIGREVRDRLYRDIQVKEQRAYSQSNLEEAESRRISAERRSEERMRQARSATTESSRQRLREQADLEIEEIAGKLAAAGVTLDENFEAQAYAMDMPEDMQKRVENTIISLRGLLRRRQAMDEMWSGGEVSPAGGMNQYSESNPAQPQTQQDFDSLPKGAIYVDPEDGRLYRK